MSEHELADSYNIKFDLQTVQTYGGSIRMRTDSLDQLQQQNAENPSAMNSGRAVQNAYSFF